MKKYCGSKMLWDLFVFSVCLKMTHGASMVRPTNKKVRRMLNCGHAKADKLIKQAKQCPELFTYYEGGNILVAKSLVNKYSERDVYTHKNKKMKKSYNAVHAFCYKFEYELNSEDINRHVSHSKVSRFLKDVLLKFIIGAKQKTEDELQWSVNSTRLSRTRALTTRKLGKSCGCHRTTISRHVKKLETAERPELQVKRNKLIFVAKMDENGEFQPLTNNQELLSRCAFPVGRFLAVRDANQYRLGSNAPVFVNVIFNHITRIVAKSKAVITKKEIELRAKEGRLCPEMLMSWEMNM